MARFLPNGKAILVPVKLNCQNIMNPEGLCLDSSLDGLHSCKIASLPIEIPPSTPQQRQIQILLANSWLGLVIPMTSHQVPSHQDPPAPTTHHPTNSAAGPGLSGHHRQLQRRPGSCDDAPKGSPDPTLVPSRPVSETPGGDPNRQGQDSNHQSNGVEWLIVVDNG